MAIFYKKNKTQSARRTEALMNYLATDSDQYSKALYAKFVDIQKNPSGAVMQPTYLYTYCMEMLMANKKNFAHKDYLEALQYGEELYRSIFVYEAETPGFDDLVLVFVEMFDEDSVVSKRSFEPTIFHLFQDKHNYIKWVRALKDFANLEKETRFLISYASAARSYYVEEEMFTAALIHFTLDMLRTADPQARYEEEMRKLSHMMGLYHIDEDRIREAEKKMDETELMITQVKNVLASAEKKSQSIDRLAKEACEKVSQICEIEIQGVNNQVEEAEKTIQSSFEHIAAEQRQSLIYEKHKLLNEVFEEAEKKLSEMKKTSQSLVALNTDELVKFKQESSKIISRLDGYLENEEQIKKMLQNSDISDELMKKVERLILLDQKQIDEAMDKIEKVSKQMVIETTVEDKKGAKASKAVQTANAQQVTPVVQEVVHASDENTQNEEMRPVNFLLDESMDFKERLRVVKERKKKMVDAGEYFHKAFDDVLMAVMENANPYLIGPSGCGKTYMISQIAKLLDTDYIDIGYINEEYDILGFQTANGGYSRPNFYRCYKYGMIAFCDELDNGNSRATVKLNSFLSNTGDASYSFPNGERVPRHPNFRMIAAGNTTGNGADSNYNTREKIEESVQQRLMPIVVGYDNEVEKKILADYKSWYEFIVLFRKATDAWSKGSYSDASGIITTRDAARIKKYLEHGSFTETQILDYEFIQTKEDSYLTFLSEYLKNHVENSSSAKSLVTQFCKHAQAKLKS